MLRHDLRKLMKRIESEARRRGFAHVSEDVVQEILCRMLEGRHAHASVEQMVIDYVRVDIGQASASKRRYDFARPQAYDEWTDTRTTDWQAQVEARIDAHTLVQGLNNYELLLIELYYFERYELAEIGELVGLTADGVGYQLAGIVKKLIGFAFLSN